MERNIESTDIEYNGSPVWHNFNKPTSGFGFSNFQVSGELEQVKSYLPPSVQYDNPVSEFDYGRNKNFFFVDHYSDYKFKETDRKDYNYADTLKTFHEINPLMFAFLSKKNIEHIQHLIKSFIWYLYKTTISDQKEEDLVAIMRSVYINAFNDPKATGEKLMNQVCTLNKDTLDIAVPIIAVNIQAHLSYVKDASTNPYTVDLPRNVSVKGLKNFNGYDTNII